MFARSVKAGLCGVIAGLSLNAAAFAQTKPDEKFIERFDPAIDTLLPPDAKLETVYTQNHFFEGPLWHHGKDGQFLTFSDIPGNHINKLQDGKVTPYVTDVFKGKDNSGATTNDRNGQHFVMVGPNGETFDHQGRMVFVGMGSGELLRREADGKITVLADSYEGHHLNAPNDLVVKSDGSIYFTDGRAGVVVKDKTPPDGAPQSGVYRWKDGKLTLITTDLPGPNGIVFSPDEKYLYVNTSRAKLIKRYTVTADGGVTGGMVFTDMSADTRIGNPDGMKIDTKGNIWVTGSGGLWVISPEGKHIATIHTPHLTNLAWGDADGKSLYLTTAGSVERLRTNVVGIRP